MGGFYLTSHACSILLRTLLQTALASGGYSTARHANHRHLEATADGVSDVSDGNALLGDRVIPSSCFLLLQRQPVEPASIEPVHRGPAVEPLARIR